MRQKFIRHSRSVISVILTVCMLVSCMAVGLVSTDAAQVDSDSVGASFYILMSTSDNIPSWGEDRWIDVPVTQSGSKFTATIPRDKFSSVDGLTTGKNYFLCISNSKSGSGAFFDNESVTSSVSGTKFSANAIQEKDTKRAVRFSMASVEGVEAVVVTVTANSSTRNYALSTTDSTETKYGVTVTAQTGGSVVAGSTAIAAGKSTTVQVSNTNAMTFTATPASGYSFGGWEKTGGVTLSSGYDLSSTTIKATATAAGTLTAKFTKNAVQTRVVYYDNSQTDWTTPYARAYDDSGNEYLGAAPGTAMTVFDAANKVWYINVPVDATTIVFSNNGSAPCSAQTIPTGYTGLEFYDYTGTAGTGAWKKYTSPLQPNEKNATLATETANNKDLYTNINATFFDYFTDHEVNGSWYSSIDYSDAWIDTTNSPIADDQKDPTYWSFINRNPYTIFNQQLSAYANANNVTSPLYFGSFIEDGYRNPGYYRSGMLVNGDLINDSNTLGENRTPGHNSRALPGLAADTLTAGNIYYSSGKKMELFDKEWLLTRSTDTRTPSANIIYFDPGLFPQNNKYHSWSDDGAKFRILQKDNTGNWWDGSELSYDSTLGLYYKELVSTTNQIKFVRCDSGLGDGTFYVDASTGTLKWSDSNTDCGWNYIHVDTSHFAKNCTLYRVTGWTTYDKTTYTGQYSDCGSYKPLAEIVNSKFPVRKKTQDYHDYYEFDSYNAQDNIWFENLTTTPVLHYGKGSANGVKNGYNADYGFFPFDKHGNNDGYGKDLAFGMKLEINFTLGKDGQIKGTDGHFHDQKFDFSGDDDLWVYIDDQLVLDLGGDHSKTIGSINFHDRSLTYTPDPNTTLGSKKTTFTINNNDTSKVHKMTLFYLERGMQESNLKFGFSFIPVANQFIATESMSNEGVNPALQEDVNSAWTYDKITVTHETAKNVDENNPDQASYSLAANKDYKLKGDPSTQHTGNTGTYNLGNGGKATFVAQFDDGAGDDEPSSSSSQPDYFKLTTTSASGNVFKYNTVLNSVTDLVMEQYVTQLGTDKNIFKFRSLKTPKNSLDATDIQADFVSTISTKNIIISKSILGYSDPDKEFTVHVQLDIDGDGTKYSFKDYALKYIKNGVESNMTDGTFTLKQDEVAIIQGIPEGAKVKISEENVASLSDPHYQHLSTEVLDNDGKTVIPPAASGQPAEFKLDKDVQAEITNKPRLQDITVTKQTDVDDYDSEFKIKIETSSDNSTWTAKTDTLYGNDHNNTPITRTVDSNGFYTVKKGDTLFIRNIPEDNYVRVTESKPTSANYDFTKSAVTVDGRDVTTGELADGTYKQDSNATQVSGWYQVKAANNNVIVDNKVQKQTFTIKKVTDVNNTSDEFKIKVYTKDTASAENWTPYTGSLTSDNGSTVTASDDEYIIHKDEVLTVSGLKANSLVKVEESDCNDTKYEADGIVGITGTTVTVDGNGVYTTIDAADKGVIVKNKIRKFTVTIVKEVVDENNQPIVDNTDFNISIDNGGTTSTGVINKSTPKTVVLNDVPYGTNVTVTEQTPLQRGYQLKDISGNGEVTGNKTITVTNTKLSTYNVKVTKKITEGTANNKEFSVEIKTNGTPYTYAVNGGTEASVSDGAATTVQLKSDEYVIVGGLLAGEKLTVTETNDGDPDYAFVNFTVNETNEDGSNKSYEYTVTNAADQNISVNNKKVAKYQFEITYIYESYSAKTYKDNTAHNDNNRVVGGNRSYTQKGEISTADLSEFFNKAVDGSLSFKDGKRKEFINKFAPYEDDFMLNLRWNDSDPKPATYDAPNKTIRLETKATSETARTVRVKVKMPWSNGAYVAVPEIKLYETQYGDHVYDNDGSFLTAPQTLDNNGTTMYFKYWQIKTDYDNKDTHYSDTNSKRCYYDSFNMTMYQDSYVEAVYGTTETSFNPSAQSYADTENGEARIAFMETSRNQWNNNGGTDSDGAKKLAGDRVYTDFQLTFGYQDILLNTAAESGIKTGFVMEQVALLDKVDDKIVIKKESEYRTQYDGDAAQKTARENAVKAYIADKSKSTYTDTSGTHTFKLNSNIALTTLDNKNQCKHSVDMSNKVLRGDNLEEGTLKNYVYRAYTYIQLSDGSIVLSDPVYFTIYYVATINNGTTN